MNYYKRHLGDIAKSCSDLSQGQMGAYDLLLDWHYANEKPIPLAPDKVHMIGRARTKAERDNVDSVLAELFTKTETGYIHKRAGEEMEKAAIQAEANRQIALQREATKRARNEHDSCTNDEPSHKPLATSHVKAEKREKTASAVSLPAVLELYHAILPSCQSVAVITDKRKRAFASAEKIARQICAANGWEYGLDFWHDFFTECSRDPWTRGEKPNPNNPSWKQNLGTLISEDHFAKIMDRALENPR